MGLRRAILAFAFPAMLTATAGGEATQAGAQDQVTFAAWNLRNYFVQPSQPRGTNAATPAKATESVDAVVATLAKIKPDILGLCEVGSEEDLADLQSRLKASGVNLAHRTWLEGVDQERHLALLSRFPLASVQHDTRSTFSLGGLPYRVRRGFLDCTVALRPDFLLRILGTHLKSRRPVPEYDQAEYRRQESLLLRRYVETILQKEPATPLLLFGDFNDTKNSPVVRDLLGGSDRSTALSILPLADRVGDQWTYHWAETDEYSRVDYVMVSRTLRPSVARRKSYVYRAPDWRKASDHRPLVVVLQLPKPPEPKR